MVSLLIGDFRMTKKRQYRTADIKAKVALEAIKGELTVSQICSKYEVESSQVSKWKSDALQNLSTIFAKKNDGELESKNDEINILYKQVGKLTIQNEFLREKLKL